MKKQIDETHLHRHKPVKVIPNKHTDDFHVAKLNGSVLNPHLSQVLRAFDKAYHYFIFPFYKLFLHLVLP